MSEVPKSGNRAPLLIGAAVVVVLVVVTLWARRPSPVVETAALADAPVAESVQVPDAAARGARRTVDGRPVVVAHDPDLRAKARAEHSARITKMREEAEATYRAETVDAAWAPGKERELARISALEGVEAAQAVKPSSLDIDCRSTMCAVNATFASDGAAQDWLLMFTSSLGDAMPRVATTRVDNPDGTVTVRMYGKSR